MSMRETELPGVDLPDTEEVAAEEALGEPPVLDIGKRRTWLARQTRLTHGMVGVALIVAGLALMLVGTTVLAHGVAMGLRVVLTLAGVVVIYLGIREAGRARWGQDWDAAYWLSLVWLVVIIAAAILAPLLPLGEASDSAKTLTEPVLARPALFSEHPFGTNNLGLDLLSRTIYGARVSLVVSVAAVVIGIVVGGALGLVAGYLRKFTDSAVGILTNTWLAFPPLVLLLTLAAVLPRNTRNLAIALGVLAIPVNIRLARANTLMFAQREFVMAAEAIGAKRRRIMARELMPNVLLPLLTYGLITVAVLIVAEASLSFLGLGVQQPQPSWGNMIAEGQNGVFEANPHIVFVPGVALFLTVFAFNLVGEKLRKRFGAGEMAS